MKVIYTMSRVFAVMHICLFLLACLPAEDVIKDPIAEKGEDQSSPFSTDTNGVNPEQGDGNSQGNSDTDDMDNTLVIPEITLANAGDQQISVSWDDSLENTKYNLYLASESGVEPLNYSVLSDGVAFLDVTSPYQIKGLTNDKKYFIVLTTEKVNLESDSSIEVSAIPVSQPAITVDESLVMEQRSSAIILAATENFNQNENLGVIIKAPDIAENGAVVSVTADFQPIIPGPGALWIVVPNNPVPIAAKFLIQPNVLPVIATRIKMKTSGDIIGVYETTDGDIYTAKKYVNVTISGY